MHPTYVTKVTSSNIPHTKFTLILSSFTKVTKRHYIKKVNGPESYKKKVRKKNITSLVRILSQLKLFNKFCNLRKQGKGKGDILFYLIFLDIVLQ